METEQSELTFTDSEVHKVYKRDHAFFDPQYFSSEVRSLSKLAGNKYIVGCHDIGDCEYKMPRYDFALGDTVNINFKNLSRILFSMSIDGILNNLDNILDALASNGVRHRDINPGNILYSEKERCLKLTDFFWSDSSNSKVSLPEPTEQHPWEVNGVFGTDDYLAIDKIKNLIKANYHVNFVEKCAGIHSEFLRTVGVGGYRDGSSVYNGYAYHIVDIPQLKNKIKYHKDTCIEEYELIKDVMPIEPKSFIDIGAANGYFTFNLLRDYNVEYALCFEADPGVAKFLRDVKDLYDLKEIEACEIFDDTVKHYGIYDIAIWLNSHMWVYKQLGKERTLKCVANIIDRCKYMFFQTCGAYSSGMYRVMEYKDDEDIYHMLFDAGAVDVKVIGKFVGSHDAPRHMFLVKGKGGQG